MSILETLPNKKMPYWTSVMIPKFKRIMMKYDIDEMVDAILDEREIL